MVHMCPVQRRLYINETYATAVVLLVIVIGINCCPLALGKTDRKEKRKSE